MQFSLLYRMTLTFIYFLSLKDIFMLRLIQIFGSFIPQYLGLHIQAWSRIFTNISCAQAKLFRISKSKSTNCVIRSWSNQRMLQSLSSLMSKSKQKHKFQWHSHQRVNWGRLPLWPPLTVKNFPKIGKKRGTNLKKRKNQKENAGR